MHDPSYNTEHTWATRLARLRIPVWRVLVVGSLLALALGQSAWPLPLLLVMGVAGVGLAGLATAGRLWCALFISGRKTRELVTTGPYAWCRNPLYLFNLVGMTGIALASGSVTIVGLVWLGYAVVYRGVILHEERDLRHFHGAAFDAYAARVPRLIPKGWPEQAAEHMRYETEPRAYARNISDSVWFPAVAALFFALAVGKAKGVVGLGALFTLW
jgi:protein-S-isoprenylcysteine O-methyltransferase Ste14